MIPTTIQPNWMRSVKGGAAGEAEKRSVDFQHLPLDHTKASIRLLRIEPNLSPRGLIQCQIWHDSIDAQYTCLSYVWGPEDDGQDIVLNGSHIRVRSNLHNFLKIARMKYAEPKRALWIDALCIDQSSILERNHQVARMGSIYAGADEVIGWLGVSEGIERALRFCVETSTLTPQSEKDSWKLWLRQRDAILRDWEELQTQVYWERAWITQEILSATRYKLLANHFEADPTQFSVLGMLLPAINNAPVFNGTCRSDMASSRLFTSYIENLCGKTRLDCRFVELLHRFPGRHSQIPRDRLYSLLSIAEDVDSFPIDYGGDSDQVLLAAIHHFKDSMCLCMWLYMASTLEYPKRPYIQPRKRDAFWFWRRPVTEIRNYYPQGSTTSIMPVVSLFLYNCLDPDTKNLRNCEDCGYGPIPKKGPYKHVFCTRQICNGVTAQHFWLIPASAPESFKHSRYHSLKVQSVAEAHSSVEKKFGTPRISYGTLYRIELSAEVLLELCQPISSPTPWDVYQEPLELCASARLGHPMMHYEAEWDKRTHVLLTDTYVALPV